MAQKFLSLDEAAAQLGISKDRLNELRQHNKVTGYKDGASWKFRPEAIEKLATEGIPQIDPMPSGISLDEDEDLGLAPPAEPSKEKVAPPKKPPVAAADESDLELAVEDSKVMPTPKPTSGASDLS